MSTAFQIFTFSSQQALDTAANVLSGATLTFSLTGTSTPAQAYSDAGLTAGFTSIAADSAGVFAPIFLDPNVVYRVVLKTQGGATLKTWDPANEAVLTAASFNALYFLTDDHKQTPAEIAAGVTPVNYAYGPGVVDRYGTNTTPGTTSMASAAQAAINVAKQCGCDVVFGPTLAYLIDAPLDLTVPVGGTNYSFKLRSVSGQQAAVTTNAPYRPIVIFKHTGIALDTTGSLGQVIENISFTTDTSTYPTIFLLCARNSDGRSRLDRFTNVSFWGYCSKTVVYNYGMEDDSWLNPRLINLASNANSSVFDITRHNIRSISSTFTTIATGNQSTIDHKIFGGEIAHNGGVASQDAVRFDDVSSIAFYSTWMNCSSASVSGRALFYVDGTNGPTSQVIITGILGEAGSVSTTYGILFSNNVQSHVNWRIESNQLVNTGGAMIAQAGANVTWIGFRMFLNNPGTGGGILVPGTISGAYCDTGITITGTAANDNNSDTLNKRIVFNGETTLELFDSSQASGSKAWKIRNSSTNLIMAACNDSGTPTANALILSRAGGPTGYGTPTGNSVIANFPGNSATLLQTSQTVASILVALKAAGLINA